MAAACRDVEGRAKVSNGAQPFFIKYCVAKVFVFLKPLPRCHQDMWKEMIKTLCLMCFKTPV